MDTHTTTQTDPRNYYSAERNPSTKTWRGWMQYHDSKNIVMTPDSYSTKREALAAIKAQHPGEGF